MPEATTTIREVQGIPQELVPFFTGAGTAGQADYVPGLLGKAQEIYSRDYASTYAPYLNSQYVGANRVAPLGETEAGQAFASGIKGLTTPGGYAAGQGYLGDAASGFKGYGQVAPGQLTAYQMAAPDRFGAEQAQSYMSDYAQNVTDIAKRKAIEDAQRAQLATNLNAGRRGTLGTSGNLLATTERERNLNTLLGDIQGKGLQDAYLNAQTQFERDRAAQMMANQQNLQAQLSVQQLGAGQSLEAQRANQAAALQASQGLAGLGQAAGQLSTLQQAADIDRLKMLGAYSDLERGVEQQKRDIGYADIMRQVQLPEQQLMGMSSLLRGVPMGDRIGSQTAVTSPPSFLSQLSGLGLTGLSLYNLAGKRD